MDRSTDTLAQLLEVACEITDSQELDAFLSKACGDDAELRQVVMQLVKNHRASTGFLEQPAELAGLVNTSMVEFLMGGEAADIQIPGFEQLQKVGKGAFGTVYRAAQVHPIRRTVAIKVLSPGMDSAEVIARFEAERQALALMDHPHIAKIFDAGTTDAGRPYFVMEYVAGVAITEHCDAEKLGNAARLRLMIDVCQAVQHAHHKGIIHRDLKPNNILVSKERPAPVVKVIDFGIAKALRQRLIDRTLVTNARQLLGTPLYMSPEQANFTSLDVDTRSDVYSLGVILYELLTGTTPFSKDMLSTATHDELRRIICEVEPARPSRRLSTLDAQNLTTVALRRNVDTDSITRGVQGELDWIVMTALEKDPARRYDSPNALAADLQRHLAGEVVLANPPSRSYQLRKFASRYRVVLTTSFLMILALVVGTAVATWQAIEANAAQRRAQAESKRATAEEANARAQQKRAEDRAMELRAVVARSSFQSGLHQHKQGDEAAGIHSLLRAVAMIEPESDLAVGYHRVLLDRLVRGGLQSTPPLRHGAAVTSVAFNNDGTLCATVDKAGIARLWETSTGLAILPLSRQLHGASGVTFSSVTTHVATSYLDGTVRVWDYKTAAPVGSVMTHTNRVTCLTYSPDGMLILTGSLDQTAKLWDATSGALLQTAKLDGAVRCAAFHPSGKWFATGSANGHANFWSTSSATSIGAPMTHATIVRSLQFSRDGSTFATGSHDRTARVWHSETGAPVAGPFQHASNVTCVSLNNDGTRLVTSSEDSTAAIWDVATQARIGAPMKHRSYVWTAAFNDLGDLVVTASQDGGARVWSARDASLLGSAMLQAGGCDVAIFSPHGSRILSGSYDRTARLWDTRTLRSIATPLRRTSIAYAVASADGKQVLVAAPEHHVILSRAAPSAHFEVFDLPDSVAGRCAALCPGRDVCATGGFNGVVQIWNLSDRSKRHSMRSGSNVFSMAFSPDGKKLVTGHRDGTARLWDVESGASVGTPLLHGDIVRGVAFHPDGTCFATGCENGIIQLWNTQDHHPLESRLALDNQLLCIAFHPNGRLIAGGSGDGDVRLWDLKTGQEDGEICSHPQGIYSIAFTDDGRRMATGTLDGTACIWDVSTRATLGNPMTHDRSVAAVSFCEDGRRLVTACFDGTVQIWDSTAVDPEKIARQALDDAIRVWTGRDWDSHGTLRALSAEELDAIRRRAGGTDVLTKFQQNRGLDIRLKKSM